MWEVGEGRFPITVKMRDNILVHEVVQESQFREHYSVLVPFLTDLRDCVWWSYNHKVALFPFSACFLVFINSSETIAFFFTYPG